MSYCINPSCPHPKNPNNVQVCQACGGKLRLNGRYQILGTLGKGGFGATFAAADVGLPGTPICVVKQLRPATDDPAVFKMAKQLFEREAQTLGKVGVHPQIPTLLGYFEENQEFYLVQEYVKGNNLHQEVKKNGAFSEEGVKQLLSELLPILTYIHSEKVIHRDIKPANLIRSQADKRLVLIDFGAVKNDANSVLAASSSPQTALTNFAIGTAVFAPPEQMAMRPVYASDIYALGMTAIYLLTGMSLKDIECNHQTGEMDWQKYVTVSDSFATVLKKMTELAIKYRYKSAEEVLDALNVLPYQEGMMQGLIGSSVSTSPSSKGTAEKTTFRTAGTVGRSSLDTSSTTRIRSNFQGNDQSTTSLTTPQTTIRTRGTPSPDTMLNGSISRDSQPTKQTSTSINRGLAEGGNGGVAYNVSVQPNQGGGRGSHRRSPNDMTVVNKPIQWTTKALLGAYENGQRDFTDQSFQNLIVGKAFLPAINFYQSDLSYANFQNTDLTRADFGKAILGHTSFKDANLSEAYFGYANLEGADLRGATVAGANFKYANLRGANFCGVDLSSAFVTPDQLATAKTNWRTVMPNGKRGFR
jgi:serine/threonine-protein kinase